MTNLHSKETDRGNVHMVRYVGSLVYRESINYYGMPASPVVHTAEDGLTRGKILQWGDWYDKTAISFSVRILL